MIGVRLSRQASKGRPREAETQPILAAVEPPAPGLLAEYETGEGRFKRMIGHMARQVMEALGYEIDRPSLRITRENLLSTASRYRKAGTGRNRPIA